MIDLKYYPENIHIVKENCIWTTVDNFSTVKYVRYDVHMKMEKELRDQIKYLIAENSIQSDKE